MSNLANRYNSSKAFNFKPYAGKTVFDKDRSGLNIDAKPRPYSPGNPNAGSKYAPKSTTRYTP
jgi:hypothetical protein